MLCSCRGGCFGKGSETADPVTSTTRTLLSCASPHSKGRAEPCTGLCPPARGSQGVCTQARARCTRGGAQSSPTPGLTFKPLIRDPKTALITVSCLAEGLSQEGTSGVLTPDPNPVSDQAAQVFDQLGLEILQGGDPMICLGLCSPISLPLCVFLFLYSTKTSLTSDFNHRLLFSHRISQ